MTPPLLSAAAGAAGHTGRLLLYASLEGAVVIALVWAICRLLARGAPQLRCTLWWTACLKLIVGLSGIVLVSLPWLPAAAPHAPLPFASDPADPGLASIAARAVAGGSPWISSWISRSISPFVSPWVIPLIAFWFAGVLASVAVTGRQMWRARAVIRHASPVLDPRISALFADLARRVGLERPPRLRVSDAVIVPQVVGALSPVVILPRAHLDAFSECDLAMALCHELVHVRRKDLWLGWVPALARRVFFFHPAVAAADHEYRVAREAACDAEVLRVLEGSASRYGQLLVKMSVLPSGALAPSAAVASPFLDLQRRLHMLEQTQGSSRAGKARWAAIAVVALAILVPVRVVAHTSHSVVDAHSDEVTGDSPDNAYIYFLDDENITMNGSVDTDLPRARAARGGTQGELLWFRIGDDAYLVANPKVLAMVRDLHAENSKLDSGQEDLDRKQAALEAKEEKLSQEEEKLSAKIDALTQKRETLQETQEGKSDDEIDVDAAEDLQKIAVEIRNLQHRQQELERAIESLSKQREGLDGEQERMGNESDRNSRIIDEKIYRLLKESIPAGFAERVK